MNKEELFSSGLLEMYVLGLTSPEETRMVEEAARRDPSIQKEIDSLHRALEQYASQQAIPPPPGLKRKVLKRVNTLSELEEGAPPASVQRKNGYTFIAIAASILFLLTSLFFIYENNALQSRIAELDKEKYQQAQACEEEKKSMREKDRIFALLTDPETRPLQLVGSPISPTASAMVYWNEHKRTVLINAKGMPAPPEGKQYQVWADVDGEMINMGLLSPETDTVQRMNYIAKAESVNITLEPMGGSLHPTVSLLYANAPLNI